MNTMEIDWTPFDEFPENTCYCRCGAVYRSHGKYSAQIRKTVTRRPCPSCGRKDDCRQISSDPEVMVIRR